MKANELTWKEIKELAEIATENGYDFNIEIKGDNTNINVKKSQNQTTYIPQTQNVRDIEITYPDTRYPWDNVWYYNSNPYYSYPIWMYNPTITTTTKLKVSTDTNTETWNGWTTSGYVDTRKEGESK